MLNLRTRQFEIQSEICSPTYCGKSVQYFLMSLQQKIVLLKHTDKLHISSYVYRYRYLYVYRYMYIDRYRYIYACMYIDTHTYTDV